MAGQPGLHDLGSHLVWLSEGLERFEGLMRNHSPKTKLWSFPHLSSVTIFFNRQWWWTTLIVAAALVVLVRLGFWQLNRLEQRRTRNAIVAQQLAFPPLLLTDSERLPRDLTSLKMRQATAFGEFDFAHQVALTYQNWQGVPGIHLITPRCLLPVARKPCWLIGAGFHKMKPRRSNGPNLMNPVQ